ncbi:hypothetical protein WJX74_001151 [Apatococcus lobatus]|uniref:Uncharacterized protein n=1 Tax=Apatococcus lobatus TaxID=904363 RepID=A0AAW1RJ09_9CHLO
MSPASDIISVSGEPLDYGGSSHIRYAVVCPRESVAPRIPEAEQHDQPAHEGPYAYRHCEIIKEFPQNVPAEQGHPRLGIVYGPVEPPMVMFLGTNRPQPVPTTEHYCPPTDGVATSVVESWFQAPLDGIHFNPKQNIFSNDANSLRATQNCLSAWVHKLPSKLRNKLDLFRQLLPHISRQSSQQVEQAKAQAVQQLHERARKQNTAAAQPPPAAQQASTPQDSTCQTTFRQSGFFSQLTSNPRKRWTSTDAYDQRGDEIVRLPRCQCATCATLHSVHRFPN